MDLIALAEREALEELEELAKCVECGTIDFDVIAKRDRITPDTETTRFLLMMARVVLSNADRWPVNTVLRVMIAAITSVMMNTAKRQRTSGLLLEQAKRTENGNIMLALSFWKQDYDLATEPEAQEALAFLAAAIPLKLFSRSQRQGLRERARQEGKSRTTVRQEILSEALIQAILSSDIPATYFFYHRGYVVDNAGKHLTTPPLAATLDLYSWWLRKEARQIARNDLAQRTTAPTTVPSPNPSNDAEKLLARTNELQSLETLLSEPYMEQFRGLLLRAGGTHNECTVWLLHRRGHSYSAIARSLGKATGTIKHQFHKMDKKWQAYRSRNPA